MLETKGAGVLLRKSTDIVPTIQNLVSDNARYLQMKAATAGLTMPNSTEQIVREINALWPHLQSEPVRAAA